MSDMLQDAVEYLDDIRQSYLSHSVTYSRGTTSMTLLATPSVRDFIAEEFDGTMVTHVLTDWIVNTSDLAALGLPKRGDIIEWTPDATAYTYEVVGPGGAPVYEDADPYRHCVRIHSKLVSEA